MKPFFSKVVQVGLVVRDLDATLQTYVERYGIGPWDVYRFTRTEIDDTGIAGPAIANAMRAARCTIGNTCWLLFQPLDEDGGLAGFLKGYGEGVHHLGVLVDDGEAARAFCRENLLPLADGGRYASEKVGIFDSGWFCDARRDLKTRLRLIPADSAGLPEPDDVYPQGSMPRDPVFTDVIHVSFLCKNLRETARTFAEKYGIGPWIEYPLDPSTTTDMHLAGEPGAHAVDLALCDVGDTIQWELLQPRDEISDYAKLLRQKAEVFHNAALKFDMSYREMLDFCDDNGIRSIQGGYWQKFRYEYRDFRPDLKVMVELFGPDPDFTWPEPAAVHRTPD